MHCNKQWVLAAEIAFNTNKSGSVWLNGVSELSIILANSELQTSVCCSWFLAALNASLAAKCSRTGSCAELIPIACVWLSVIARSPSTHSCLALASDARNFKISPEAQLIVKVLESSSLGQTTAPAKWAYN